MPASFDILIFGIIFSKTQGFKHTDVKIFQFF